MKKRVFELHWRTGELETIQHEDMGDQLKTLASALTYHGYGSGVLPALDYWKEITQSQIGE